MAEAVLQEVETYISRLQNTVAQFIKIRPIMDLCLLAERRMGSRVPKRWWEQYGLDVEAMWTADQEAEGKDGGGVDRWDRDGYRLSRWENNLANLVLGTETNYPLAYATVLELKMRALSEKQLRYEQTC